MSCLGGDDAAATGYRGFKEVRTAYILLAHLLPFSVGVSLVSAGAVV